MVVKAKKPSSISNIAPFLAIKSPSISNRNRPVLNRLVILIEISRSPGVKPKSEQMNYDDANLNWEEFFIQEALELEEKMSSFHFEDLQRSRLRERHQRHFGVRG